MVPFAVDRFHRVVNGLPCHTSSLALLFDDSCHTTNNLIVDRPRASSRPLLRFLPPPVCYQTHCRTATAVVGIKLDPRNTQKNALPIEFACFSLLTGVGYCTECLRWAWIGGVTDQVTPGARARRPATGMAEAD